MTLDGKIATARGESKWITGEPARQHALRQRLGHDAILVGVNTVLADDPLLTARSGRASQRAPIALNDPVHPRLRRIVLDSRARTPTQARLIADDSHHLTTIVVSDRAPIRRVAALRRHVNVLVGPSSRGRIDLAWLLAQLGSQEVTSLLVEGGGTVQAAFLMGGFAHRITFYYAPKILGGAQDHRAVAGTGARSWNEILRLAEIRWRRLGEDLLLNASVPARLATPASPA
jgi:diaminohydroxyphosphoribosylaminopyrimidine deaminase/5-amino-6-(5-phosphoribosylamino)uracil reductase